MTQPDWQTEHSVETIAGPEFAWAYMTNVANWDDPPAQFRFNGPFKAGERGTTEIPGQPTRHWHLQIVQPIETYTIEFSLDRATLSFTWRFNGLPDGRTRLTQVITLQGAYLPDVQQAFASGLAGGMNRIAAAMNKAYMAGQN